MAQNNISFEKSDTSENLNKTNTIKLVLNEYNNKYGNYSLYYIISLQI